MGTGQFVACLLSIVVFRSEVLFLASWLAACWFVLIVIEDLYLLSLLPPAYYMDHNTHISTSDIRAVHISTSA